MAKYTGYTCMACQQKFQDGDDVVVCPECGTPYHRACWVKNGQCINTELHASGGSWMQERLAEENRKKQEQQHAQNVNKCPRCGTENPKSNIVCSNCGLPLYVQQPGAQPQQPGGTASNPGAEQQNNQQGRQVNPFFGFTFSDQDRCCGLNPDEEMGGERLGDVADFVNTNTIYYLPLFKKFKETGSKFSMNFVCLFFPQFYFAHRKMWRMSILTIVLLFLLGIPSLIVNFMNNSASLITMLEERFSADLMATPINAIRQLSTYLGAHEVLFSNLSTICNYIDLVVKLLCCLFGNWLYYRFVLRRVRQIKTLPLGQAELQNRLRMTGGTSIANLFFTVLIEYGLAMLLVIACVGLLGI